MKNHPGCSKCPHKRLQPTWLQSNYRGTTPGEIPDSADLVLWNNYRLREKIVMFSFVPCSLHPSARLRVTKLATEMHRGLFQTTENSWLLVDTSAFNQRAKTFVVATSTRRQCGESEGNSQALLLIKKRLTCFFTAGTDDLNFSFKDHLACGCVLALSATREYQEKVIAAQSGFQIKDG